MEYQQPEQAPASVSLPVPDGEYGFGDPDWPEADQNFEDVFKRKTEQAPAFFTARVTVCTSPTFFRWVFGFGGKIRITGPENVVSQYRNMLQQTLDGT